MSLVVIAFKMRSMERQYPKSPLVGVGSIIVERGRVLLIKRDNPPLEGQWSIPGGMLELGETVRDAAVREAREETGMDVRAEDLLGVFDRVILDYEGKAQYHYVLIDFMCTPMGGSLQAGGDASEVRWFTREEVATLPLMKDTREVIERGFAASVESRKLGPHGTQET